jgi:hypothetical protein
MGAAEDLMQRLAVSKKIMEKTEGIQRGSIDSRHMNSPRVEEFQPVQGNYNIPQEYLQENSTPKSSYDATKPLESDRIKNSKLPDEIKQLMIERPIIQPSSSSPTISNDIIEGAQRLMNMNSSNNTQQKKPITENVKTNNVSSNINMNEMKSIIRDVVRDTVRDVVREELKDAGMLVESTTDSNEVIQFKVGKHLFVGRVTKVKKLA